MPPPPAQMTTVPFLQHPFDRPELEDALRQRRRDDPAPLGAVLLEHPPFFRRQPVGLVLIVDRADELRRVGEGGIGRIDLHHRQERREWHLERKHDCRVPARACTRSCPRSRRRARRGDRARPRYRPAPGAPGDRPAARCRASRRARDGGPQGASAFAAIRQLARCTSAVIGSPRFRSAFPPSATTTRIACIPPCRIRASLWSACDRELRRLSFRQSLSRWPELSPNPRSAVVAGSSPGGISPGRYFSILNPVKP